MGDLIFLATAGRQYLHFSEAELPSERLRGIFRCIECMRLKDGGQERTAEKGAC